MGASISLIVNGCTPNIVVENMKPLLVENVKLGNTFLSHDENKKK